MLDQAPEGGCFEFRSGFVVDRHGHLSGSQEHIEITWELSQILPYRRVKGELAGSGLGCPRPKLALPSHIAATDIRKILNELI